MNDWRGGMQKSDVAVMEDITAKIKAHLCKSIEGAFHAGVELQRARVVLKDEHRWVAWLDAEFKPGWRMTAWRLMTLAEKLEKPHRKGLLSQFATSAAYELCKPSTPEGALEKATEEAEEAVSRGESGPVITTERAKEIVQEQKEEDKAAAQAAIEGLPPEQQESIRKKAREKAEREAQAAALEKGRGLLKKARDEFAKLKGLKAREVVGMIEDAMEVAEKL